MASRRKRKLILPLLLSHFQQNTVKCETSEFYYLARKDKTANVFFVEEKRANIFDLFQPVTTENKKITLMPRIVIMI